MSKSPFPFQLTTFAPANPFPVGEVTVQIKRRMANAPSRRALIWDDKFPAVVAATAYCDLRRADYETMQATDNFGLHSSWYVKQRSGGHYILSNDDKTYRLSSLPQLYAFILRTFW